MLLGHKVQRRALLGVLFGGFVLILGSVTSSGLAVAVDSEDLKGGSPAGVESPESIVKQERLDAYVDQLHQTSLLKSADNFGGDAVDYDDNAYDLWWRGEVPGQIRSVLAGFSDVTVRLHEANFTAAELEAASNKISGYSTDQFTVGLVAVEDLNDPTPVEGIKAGITKTGEISTEAIEKSLTSIAGLPVTIDDSLTLHRTSRTDDNSPS